MRRWSSGRDQRRFCLRESDQRAIIALDAPLAFYTLYPEYFLPEKPFTPERLFCLHEKIPYDIITAWTISEVFTFNSKPAACRFDSGALLYYSTSHILCFCAPPISGELTWVNSFECWNQSLPDKRFRAKAARWKNVSFLFARLNPVWYNSKVLRTL